MNSLKNYVHISYYKLLSIIKIIQKLGHHESNLCFIGKKKSEYIFFEFR